jgi:hypothetical protein
MADESGNRCPTDSRWVRIARTIRGSTRATSPRAIAARSQSQTAAHPSTPATADIAPDFDSGCLRQAASQPGKEIVRIRSGFFIQNQLRFPSCFCRRVTSADGCIDGLARVACATTPGRGRDGTPRQNWWSHTPRLTARDRPDRVAMMRAAQCAAATISARNVNTYQRFSTALAAALSTRREPNRFSADGLEGGTPRPKSCSPLCSPFQARD